MPTPTVMVSSTFYDLRQLRADLGDFLNDNLGYKALLSEFPSFPVDPDKEIIENCRKRVEENANILVLVIGGRYGSIDGKTQKSITNVEYLTARKKGIPIYAFVDKQILSVLPVWRNNPAGDYSNVVDTTKLFEFLEEVRTKEGVWTFSFETAQDIIKTFKIQLAYLFYDSLKLRNHLSGTRLPSSFENLSSNAFRIALEKPAAWEYLLFMRTWLDENQRYADIIRDYEAGLRIGTSEPVEAEKALGWIQTRLSELEGLTTSANHLLNISVQKAFGEPGQPGDPDAIIWNARKLGEVLETAVNWALRIRRARVAEPFTDVMFELAKFPTSMIKRLQNFPAEGIKAIESALAEASPEFSRKVELTMTLEISNQDGYSKAFTEAEKRFTTGAY